MNATRLFSSAIAVIRKISRVVGSKWYRTSLDLSLFHVLSRHGVASDNLFKSRSREVLLAWLLLGVSLPRILFQALQAVRLPPELVMSLFEKFARLLAHLQHPGRRQAKHFDDPTDLVVFRRSRE